MEIGNHLLVQIIQTAALLCRYQVTAAHAFRRRLEVGGKDNKKICNCRSKRLKRVSLLTFFLNYHLL